MPTARVVLPSQCSVCLGPLPPSAAARVLLSEVCAPGLEQLGDPSRLLGWCREHAPAWAVEKYDALVGDVIARG